MARAKKSKKSSVVSVDFTGVQGSNRVPEGEYAFSVAEVTKEESSNGNDYLKWKLEITEEGKEEGKFLYYNTSLQPQALWNLKSLLETLGMEVPDSSMDLDLEELVGATGIAAVEEETYEGKRQSKVVDIYNEDDVQDDEGEGKKGGKKGGKKDEDETYSEDQINDMDEEELEELVEKHDLDVNLKKLKKVAKQRAAVIEALEGLDLMEAGGEGGLTADAVNGMDEDELEELNKEHKLKVKLDKYPKIARARAAIIEALEEKGLLED